MALYSFHGQIIGRGKSIRMSQDGSVSKKAASRRSTSVAAAAYRAGTRLVDERTGEVYDYTRKGGVIHTEIMLPANAPGRYHDRQTLWNAVEQAERQSNAQLSRELRIALPSEFTREENITLVRDFVQKNFVSKGMCADVAYHIKDKNGEDHNPHVHIMLTMRPMTKSGTWWKTKSRKEYITDRKGNRIMGTNGEWKSRNVDLTGWNDKTLYVSWRSQWADACNEQYEAKGLPYRIDHRSYIEQGIHRQPTMHMGKEATALERKGISTEKGNYNRTVAACNEMAEVGIEPAGLWETAQDIFERAKERQRHSRRARVSEPSLAGGGEAKAAESRPQRPEVAQSGGQSGRSVRSQDAQRRTDAPLHGAVRQGAPCTPKKDESRPLSSEKKPPQRLETPTTNAVGERSHELDEAARQEAIRRSNIVRGAIRNAAGTNNFMVTRGAKTYDDLLNGIHKAQSEYSTCENSLNHLRSEVDKLQQLQTAVVWARDHKAITEQYERLKLFPGKFYKAHKMEIDRYRYAVKQLADASITHLVELGAFTEQLKLLETERDVLSAKLPELREELRMWCACEVYMRELLNLPKPPNIPDFSVQSKSDRQQHEPGPTYEHKQKAPATKHRHDDRGR